MPRAAVNGTTLDYRFNGPEGGPLVMLSNSLGSNYSMWEPQLPALKGAGFRVLRYDSRGHGKSAVPQGPYSMELLAADAVGLMDALSIEKVHFCGLSMGGMVGQMLGTHHGGRLRSLTLCDTTAHVGSPEIWHQRIETARNKGMANLAEATIDRWITKAGQERLPREVDKVRTMIGNTPVEGFCACCVAIRDMDQRESIRAVTTPILVIVGEEDQGTPVEAARLIHERIAKSQLVILPQAAHLANIEQAGAFNTALLKFLIFQEPHPLLGPVD